MASFKRFPITGLMIMLLACGLALFIGLLVASGNRYLILFGLAGVLAGYLLSLPSWLIVSAMAGLVYLIAGSVMYFGGVGQALLLPYGLSLVLVAKLIRVQGSTMGAPPLSALHWLLLALTAAGVFSTVVNLPPALLGMAGLKSLVGFVPVAFLLASGQLKDNWLLGFWKAVACVPITQVPFVLYQYFVVAAGRAQSGASGVAWDAVVGSFGGNPERGGASGVLAFVVLCSVFLAHSLGRQGQMSWPWRWAITLSAAVCLTLAEVKVIAVLLPLAAVVYFLPQMARRPMRALGAIVLSVMVGIAVIYSYALLHYSKRNAGTPTAAQLFDYTFGYSTDPNHINFQSGEMGRTTALRLWWNDGFKADAWHGVVGHGPGASRGKSAFGVGEVARRYPYYVDRSAATQILWDFGLFGLLVFVSLPVAAAWGALALVRRRPHEPLRPVLAAMPPIMAMSLVMVPYGRDILEVPAMSFTFMAALGTVMLVLRRQPATVRPVVQPRAQALQRP